MDDKNNTEVCDQRFVLGLFHALTQLPFIEVCRRYLYAIWALMQIASWLTDSQLQWLPDYQQTVVTAWPSGNHGDRMAVSTLDVMGCVQCSYKQANAC